MPFLGVGGSAEEKDMRHRRILGKTGCAVFYEGGRRVQIPEPWWLKASAEKYQRLTMEDFLYTLENGDSIRLQFRISNYYHLMGLHKFQDIPELMINPTRRVTQISIYRMILNGTLTEFDLQSSAFYDEEKLMARFCVFLDIEKYLYSMKNAVMPFNQSLVRGTSHITADAVLFAVEMHNGIDETGGKNYIMLFTRYDKRIGAYAPVSFFLETSDRYIANQRTLAIVNVKREGKRQ